MDIKKASAEMEEYVIRCRRWFHEHAEAGLDLPKARAYSGAVAGGRDRMCRCSQRWRDGLY